MDVEWKARQNEIDKLLPDTFNYIVSTSRDGTKALYLASNDRTPGPYYLFDVASRAFKIAFSRASWIKPETMAPMKPIQYQAKDGLTIHGYLTLPLGSDGKGLPLIVYPHGGPSTRNTWGFDPDAQFFANRGLAVLQMNGRGSTGYGAAFERAGFKQWGLAIQDDITDGVHWAIQEGIADPNRICIYGSSFGGFAALMGLVKTPELYKCGISYAGIADVESLLRYHSIRRPAQFRTVQRFRVGDFKKERKELENISPINHVDRIQAPVLLAYGGLDPIVPIDQGILLAKNLEKHKKAFELIVEENEGHGFGNETNRFKLYRKIDEFLKENL